MTEAVLETLGKNEDKNKDQTGKVWKGGGGCRQQRALDQREGTNWEESQRVWKQENQAEGEEAKKRERLKTRFWCRFEIMNSEKAEM